MNDTTTTTNTTPTLAASGFSGTKAASIVGISYRQLDYWARTNLVSPSLTPAAGSGSRRAYSYRDLLELRVIKSLLDAGIKLESVRQAFRYLRDQLDTDIVSAHLVISGSDVVLCDGEQLIDVMRRAGQGVLNVLPLGGVKTQLDAQIDAVADVHTADDLTGGDITGDDLTGDDLTGRVLRAGTLAQRAV